MLMLWGRLGSMGLGNLHDPKGWRWHKREVMAILLSLGAWIVKTWHQDLAQTLQQLEAEVGRRQTQAATVASARAFYKEALPLYEALQQRGVEHLLTASQIQHWLEAMAHHLGVECTLAWEVTNVTEKKDLIKQKAGGRSAPLSRVQEGDWQERQGSGGKHPAQAPPTLPSLEGRSGEAGTGEGPLKYQGMLKVQVRAASERAIYRYLQAIEQHFPAVIRWEQMQLEKDAVEGIVDGLAAGVKADIQMGIFTGTKPPRPVVEIEEGVVASAQTQVLPAPLLEDATVAGVPGGGDGVGSPWPEQGLEGNILRLNGFFYRGDHDWVIWINQRKITPTRPLPGIEIQTITPEAVTLRLARDPSQTDIVLEPGETFYIPQKSTEDLRQ